MVLNYQNGKIYKIVDNTNGNIYIGSTTLQLSKRLAKHRKHYQEFLNGKRNKHVRSFDILKNNDYNIILLEMFPCNSREELLKKEREYFDNLPCLNVMRPITTDDERNQYQKTYYINNKNKRCEYSKKYGEQQILCPTCNCQMRKDSLRKHEKSKKHMAYVNSQNNI